MMNKAQKIIVSGVTGTTFMTGASMLMSLLSEKNFKEPEHLSTMIGRLLPWLDKRTKVIAGWSAHYIVGLLFAAIYIELWEQKRIKHSIVNGIILGALSGILGVMVWKATFKLHPLPPAIRYFDFYLQLIPAHIVFGIFATIAYRLSNAPTEKSTLKEAKSKNLVNN